jgi:hypothetical protein
MYFIFKHVKYSPYRDRPGKYYHYTQASPNHEKVKAGAYVLCYRKEADQIFAKAKIGKIVVKETKRVRNYYAYYARLMKSSRNLFFLRTSGDL